MTTIAVTGATGQLGSLVVSELLDRGVAASDIVAVVRNEAKAASTAERGVEVRVADYSDADALTAAFSGVDRVLLVSGSELGRRVEQHETVIAAAETAGVTFLAYTSVLAADTSSISLAPEHLATEKRLAASSLQVALLRNSWYWENYASNLDVARHTGTMIGSAGTGRVAGAARADLAAAAAAVLVADDQGGRVYELGSDERLTLTELAAVVGELIGAEVSYTDLSAADHVAALKDAGLPDAVAEMLASADAGIARGDLDTESGDLARLLGRAPVRAIDALRPFA